MREFLGIRSDEETARRRRLDPPAAAARTAAGRSSTAARRISRRRSRPTPRCVWRAIRADAEHMQRAASSCASCGGIEASRVFTRIWLALFGEWSLGATAGAAARGDPAAVVVPAQHLRLRVLGAPDDRAADGRRVASAGAPAAASRSPSCARGVAARAAAALDAGRAASSALDRALHVYERHPLGRCAATRSRSCAEWILRRQEADGCWGGIQPPWVYSIMALHLLGYPLDHPVLRARTRRPRALHDRRGRPAPLRGVSVAGVGHRARDGRAARRGRRAGSSGDGARRRDWLLREEIRVPGDWAVRRPQLEPGGWAFEFDNDNYPDIDDTAEVILALRAARAADADAQRRGDAARASRGPSACSAATAASPPSTSTTRARSAASCRSATSAR